MILLLVTLSFSLTTQATIHNFLELGALPNDLSDVAAWHNGRLLNDTLAALKPGLSSQSLSLERKPFQGTLCCCPTWPSTWWEASLRRTSSRSSCRFSQSGICSKSCDPSHLDVQHISFLGWWHLEVFWQHGRLAESGRRWPLFFFSSSFFSLFELKFYFWVEDCDLFFYTFFVRIGKQWPLFFL